MTSFLHAVDADKGFDSAFPATFDRTWPASHKGNNLVSHGNKGDRAVYDKALHAKSVEEMEHWKKKYSANGAAYMAKTPDSQLCFLSSGPRNCGKTSSQTAESSNGAIMIVRGAGIATGLLWFFEREMIRFGAHKKEAESQQGTLVPSFAAKQVKKMDEVAADFNRTVDVKSPRWAKVHSCGSGKVSYDGRGDDRMRCSCGKSAVETEPRDHERDAARALGIPIEEFYDEKDKVSTWRKQYSVVNTDTYVSMNEVYRERLGPHNLPAVFKKPKGRPKQNKRKKSALEMATEKAKKSAVKKIETVSVLTL